MRAPEFWASDGALATLLAPLGVGVEIAGRLRRTFARPASVGVPVICVGNLVAGGAGKTPVVLSLVEAFCRRGIDPHVLTRGYGGRTLGPHRVDPVRDTAAEVGDEALLLARAAPTWVARDRAAGARAAEAAGASVIVMDDGFQNPSIKKDLSLLVVDGAYGFGNRRVMPAGPLRETVASALARAEALVVLGPDERGIARDLRDRAPVLCGRLVPDPDSARLHGRKVLAFAGIGRPEKFFATLRDIGADLAETRSFPDHHPYAATELESLRRRAATLDATLVTTEKDAARLAPESREGIEVLTVTVEWREPEALQALLERFGATPPRAAQRQNERSP